MNDQPGAAHERRFKGEAERLRAPERVSLLEVSRVLRLSMENIQAKTALDVGTGTGIFAEAFAFESMRVTGIDPNPKLLALARTFVPHADFLEAAAEKLPFVDSSFDIAFLGHVLHETDDPQKALAEARRVARMRVAILEWRYREEEHGPPLAHRLQPSLILDLVSKAGFASVERIELSHMDFYRMTP